MLCDWGAFQCATPGLLPASEKILLMLDGRLFDPTGVPQAVANPLVAAMPARARLRVERSAVATSRAARPGTSVYREPPWEEVAIELKDECLLLDASAGCFWPISAPPKHMERASRQAPHSAGGVEVFVPAKHSRYQSAAGARKTDCAAMLHLFA